MNTAAVGEAEEIGGAFLFARDLFLPPSEEQWSRLSSPENRAAWAVLADRLAVPEELGLPTTPAAFETSFIAAFDAGAPHPPVPLIESHYNKKDPVPRVLHENILFYQSFGLRLKETSNETSDHLRHQLEFVGHLYNMEAGELRGRRDPEILVQIRAGRREFLERHLLTWLPVAAEKALHAPESWITHLVAMTLALVRYAAGESGASLTTMDGGVE